MRFLAGFCALFVLSVGGSALAADGSSGCGPAWYVFKENSILSSSIRNVLHYTSAPVVTFGMTSGTSNCAKHSLVDEKKRSLHFATRSYDILRQDMARGSGPHLDAYLSTFGCNALARQNLSGLMQAEFARELYLTIQADALVESTAALIEASPALAASCS